jgi:hypothetical protein
MQILICLSRSKIFRIGDILKGPATYLCVNGYVLDSDEKRLAYVVLCSLFSHSYCYEDFCLLGHKSV